MKLEAQYSIILTHREALALTKLLGNISKNTQKGLQLTEDQCDATHDIYSVLDDFISTDSD